MRIVPSFLMLVALFVTLQFAIPLEAAAAAKCPYTPAAGSSERKAILDAGRIPVEKELGQRVKFRATKFAVCRDWAFLEAMPQKSDGQPIDWTISSYAGDVAEGMCGFHVHALLINKDGQWTVRHYEICATDVPYVTWHKDYGAPAELFPVTE